MWTAEDLLVVRWDLRGPLRPLCLNSWWINITMLLNLWRLIFGWSYVLIFGEIWITRIHEHSYISFLILLQNSFSGYWTHSHFTPLSVKYIRRALAQKVRWRPWGLGACPDPPFRSFESASASAAGWEQDSDRYYLRSLHTDTHTTGGARWTWLTWSACALARISGSQRPRWGVGGVDRLLDNLLRLRQTGTAPTPAGSLMSHTWDEVMSIDHGG